MSNSILYLSYDGMTDPLGQSQVLTYLTGLSQKGYNITLISFEKVERFDLSRSDIESICEKAQILWLPQKYTKQPPILSTIKDIFVLKTFVEQKHKEQAFDIVHCRSYITALIGLRMKRKYGVKFIFDMRGFWVDERVEGGLWLLSNPIYKILYQFFKRKEKQLFTESDYVVSLTENAKQEIQSWNLKPSRPIQVIPCCTDFEHFDYQKVSEINSLTLRKKLGLSENTFVLLYLGSVGTWYALDEMMTYFEELKKSEPNSKFFIYTVSAHEIIYQAAARCGVEQSDLYITRVTKSNLPLYLSIADLSIVFYKKNYSRKACSPTKIAEIMGMGIPIVASSEIGDTDTIIRVTKTGDIIKEFTQKEYQKSINTLPDLLSIPKEHLRKKGIEYFSLEDGIDKYATIYNHLLNDEKN